MEQQQQETDMISDFLRHVNNQDEHSEYSSAYSLSPLSKSRAITPRIQPPIPVPPTNILMESIKYSVIKSLLNPRPPPEVSIPVVPSEQDIVA